jgi:hypothetical protein
LAVERYRSKEVKIDIFIHLRVHAVHRKTQRRQAGGSQARLLSLRVLFLCGMQERKEGVEKGGGGEGRSRSGERGGGDCVTKKKYFCSMVILNMGGVGQEVIGGGGVEVIGGGGRGGGVAPCGPCD